MAVPTSEKLIACLYVGYGSSLGYERTLLEYNENTTNTTGFQRAVIPVELAANATDVQVNLASYVDTAVHVAIYDRGGTGFSVGSGASNKFAVNAGGVLFYRSAATPGTLYLNNSSASNKAFLEVVVTGSSA